MLKGQDKYHVEREVGRGAFGAVYLARRKSDDVKVAIKMMRRSKRTGIDWTALREVKILKELKHVNVVELVDVFALEDSMNMVMEFCPFDLKKVIYSRDIVLKEEDIKAYMLMTLKGTVAMHKLWVLHRDLKPDNLLIGDDRQIKLADFGLAAMFGKELEDDDSYKVVTLPYRAPELLFGAKKYGVAVDMWSLGCILAELMIRRIMLPGTDEPDQLGKIFYMFGTPTVEEWAHMEALPKYFRYEARAPVPLKETFGQAYSADALDFLSQLMKINPAQRPTALEALDHKWFAADAKPPTPVEKLPFDQFVK